MLRCNNCNTLFEHGKEEFQWLPYGDTFVKEYYSVCPTCGGMNYDEVKQCVVGWFAILNIRFYAEFPSHKGFIPCR